MRISVIISTYNSVEWLQKVIWGFENQTCPPFELVIADDGSTQENQNRVKQIIKSSPLNIQYCWHEDDGFRKWRINNVAIKAAQGDYLIFTDGDCIPSPILVDAHMRLSTKSRFLSGGYNKLPMDISTKITEEDIKKSRCFDLKWLRSNGFPISKMWLKIGAANWGLDRILNRLTPAKRTFNGNNSSCYRDDALAVNGFDERLRYGGGDREFGYRLENNGCQAICIRYSAPCVHLDHKRGYADPELRAQNEVIIAQTRDQKLTTTQFGIAQL